MGLALDGHIGDVGVHAGRPVPESPFGYVACSRLLRRIGLRAYFILREVE